MDKARRDYGPVAASGLRAALAALCLSIGAPLGGRIVDVYVDSTSCEELECLVFLPLYLLVMAVLTWTLLRIARVRRPALVLAVATGPYPLLGSFLPPIWGPWPANVMTLQLMIVPAATITTALSIRLDAWEP